MSAIGMGILSLLVGVFLFGAQQQAGLIFVIAGCVSAFTGMANQQDQKRLKAAQLKQLSAPQYPDAGMDYRRMEDETLAAAVREAPALHVLPGSVPVELEPGEQLCFRTAATFTEARQTTTLAGATMAWDSFPASIDEGELYVTTRRVLFSGPRGSRREFRLHEVADLRIGPGVLEIHRRSRPGPTLIGVDFPAQLGAYIERARMESPTPLSSPPPLPSFPSMTPAPVLTSPVSATLNRPGSGPAAVPSFITCKECGSANGLSANFCQNCAAPITAGSTPTLIRPGQIQGQS